MTETTENGNSEQSPATGMPLEGSRNDATASEALGTAKDTPEGENAYSVAYSAIRNGGAELVEERQERSSNLPDPMDAGAWIDLTDRMPPLNIAPITVWVVSYEFPDGVLMTGHFEGLRDGSKPEFIISDESSTAHSMKWPIKLRDVRYWLETPELVKFFSTAWLHADNESPNDWRETPPPPPKPPEPGNWIDPRVKLPPMPVFGGWGCDGVISEPVKAWIVSDDCPAGKLVGGCFIRDEGGLMFDPGGKALPWEFEEVQCWFETPSLAAMVSPTTEAPRHPGGIQELTAADFADAPEDEDDPFPGEVPMPGDDIRAAGEQFGRDLVALVEGAIGVVSFNDLTAHLTYAVHMACYMRFDIVNSRELSTAVIHTLGKIGGVAVPADKLQTALHNVGFDADTVSEIRPGTVASDGEMRAAMDQG